MDVEKLKQRIQMKETFEDEIKEELESISKKAIEIMVENDEIFNSTQLEPAIFKEHIQFKLPCDVEYDVLNELNNKLNPSKILLTGGGNDGVFWTNATKYGYILLKLYFG